jgi:hypothetical protein
MRESKTKLESIKYEDIARCFETLFDYVEGKNQFFKREEYIEFAKMINKTIQLEKAHELRNNKEGDAGEEHEVL